MDRVTFALECIKGKHNKQMQVDMRRKSSFYAVQFEPRHIWLFRAIAYRIVHVLFIEATYIPSSLLLSALFSPPVLPNYYPSRFYNTRK